MTAQAEQNYPSSFDAQRMSLALMSASAVTMQCRLIRARGLGMYAGDSVHRVHIIESVLAERPRSRRQGVRRGAHSAAVHC